jgi:hypothetical protein
MTDDAQRQDEGGESACFAHLICPECGIVLDGSPHPTECHWEASAAGLFVSDDEIPDA